MAFYWYISLSGQWNYCSKDIIIFLHDLHLHLIKKKKKRINNNNLQVKINYRKIEVYAYVNWNLWWTNRVIIILQCVRWSHTVAYAMSPTTVSLIEVSQSLLKTLACLQTYITCLIAAFLTWKRNFFSKIYCL